MKLFSNNIVEYKSTEGCKIYPIVVDIKKGFKSGELISFVTADNQVGVISVELIDGNSPYVIEGNLVTATIHRPDDSVLEMVCENVEGNIVTIELGVNGTFMDGVHTFDIKIHRGDDKIVGIPTMSYTVHKSLSSDGCIEEEDKLPIISNLTNEVLRLNGEWDAFTDKFGDIDWEEMQNMGANSVTVNGTKYTQVNGNIALPSYPTLSSLGAEPKNSNIQAHISSIHAPSNAQKNSDITKAEIEAKLIGNITTHTHNQYLTQHQDLSHLALKTELHNHSNKSVLDNITNAKVVEWNNKSTFSGSYNDLSNKPTIPSLSGYATEKFVKDEISKVSIDIDYSLLAFDTTEIVDLPYSVIGIVDEDNVITLSSDKLADGLYTLRYSNGEEYSEIGKLLIGERKVTRIIATKTKTSYIEGDSLTTNDITVTAYYNDNTSSIITGYKIDSSSVSMSTKGNYPLKISYMDCTTNITIIVNASSVPKGNLFVASTCTIGKRISSSGQEKDQANTFLTDFIEIGKCMSSGGVNTIHWTGFHLYGITSQEHTDAGVAIGTLGGAYRGVAYYDDSNKYLGQDSIYTTAKAYDSEGNYQLTLNKTYSTATKIRIFGVTLPLVTSVNDLKDCKLTLNQLISEI